MSTTDIQFPAELLDYFAKLDLDGIHLTQGQKLWYSKKKELLQEDITREYPSSPREAFQSSREGYWYARQLQELYDNNRATVISYDRAIPVHTAWDLGQRDATAIWFFQINRTGDIMVIDYFERSDFPLNQISQILNEKGYSYGTHIWPFDARSRDKGGITFEMQAKEFNLHGLVLEQHGLIDGINRVRSYISKMWFDRDKCKDGLKNLSSYKKKWNNQTGGFTSIPVHDSASHGSDAMRYLCAGVDKISCSSSLEDDIKAINRYMGVY